ncbi:hypothetical protein AWQ24_11590 [Picosynechococcus sp. PCC 8807]|nr:hypothetical protein AWQ24_11590 [Picosynechococcus sp. PCC 8807]
MWKQSHLQGKEKNMVRVKPYLFCLAIGCWLGATPGAIANPEPGWEPWRPNETEDDNWSFSAGFSNLELGGYMDYEYTCTQAATAVEEEPVFEYRLNSLVKAIGTGQVQYRCLVNDQVVAQHTSTATLNDQPSRGCLIVQSDLGTGLNVRQEPTVAAPVVGFLSNGSQIMVTGSPAYLSEDATGRTWLYIPFQQDYAWTSVMAEAGGHINYRFCD